MKILVSGVFRCGESITRISEAWKYFPDAQSIPRIEKLQKWVCYNRKLKKVDFRFSALILNYGQGSIFKFREYAQSIPVLNYF